MFQVREENIIKNTRVASDLFLMEVSGNYEVKAGQFFMLKAKNADMTLYRPISIFDCGENSVSFLYSIRGKGTQIFSELKEKDRILLHGPYGNGFEKTDESLALIGGGIGMAPLHLAAKESRNSKLYIGLREHQYTEAEISNIQKLFEGISCQLVIGGFVTDAVDYGRYERVYACGPEIMMEIASQKHPKTYVSLEKHMGCGIGACLSCSCKVDGQMKRVCKDGPVFLGKEVF